MAEEVRSEPGAGAAHSRTPLERLSRDRSASPQRRRTTGPMRHRLHFEPLEARLLLSADPLTIDLPSLALDFEDNDVLVRFFSETVTATQEIVEKVQIVDRANPEFYAEHELRAIGSLAILTGKGDDTLSLDFRNFTGLGLPRISFDGGDGNDRLLIFGRPTADLGDTTIGAGESLISYADTEKIRVPFHVVIDGTVAPGTGAQDPAAPADAGAGQSGANLRRSDTLLEITDGWRRYASEIERTSEVSVEGSELVSDTLTIELAGLPDIPIHFAGGGGQEADRLILAGGSFEAVRYAVAGPEGGTIDLVTGAGGALTVSYDNATSGANPALTAIRDESDARTRLVRFDGDHEDSVLIEATQDASGEIIRVAAPDRFNLVVAAPSETFIVETGDGADVIMISGTDGTFAGITQINVGSGTDHVTVDLGRANGQFVLQADGDDDTLTLTGLETGQTLLLALSTAAMGNSVIAHSGFTLIIVDGAPGAHVVFDAEGQPVVIGDGWIAVGATTIKTTLGAIQIVNHGGLEILVELRALLAQLESDPPPAGTDASARVSIATDGETWSGDAAVAGDTDAEAAVSAQTAAVEAAIAALKQLLGWYAERHEWTTLDEMARWLEGQTFVQTVTRSMTGADEDHALLAIEIESMEASAIVDAAGVIVIHAMVTIIVRRPSASARNSEGDLAPDSGDGAATAVGVTFALVPLR